MEAAGIEPASESLQPQPLHACPGTVFRTAQPPQPGKACASLVFNFALACATGGALAQAILHRYARSQYRRQVPGGRWPVLGSQCHFVIVGN